MNKIIELPIALLSIAVLLCGCGSSGNSNATQQVIAATSLPFVISGSVTLDEVETPVELTATRSSHSLVLELASPEPVSGMRLEFDEGVIHLSYREMIMNLEEGDIPQGSLFVALRDMLAALPPTAEQVTREGDSLIVNLGTAGGKMYWSSDGMSLNRIEMPTAGAVYNVASFCQIP